MKNLQRNLQTKIYRKNLKEKSTEKNYRNICRIYLEISGKYLGKGGKDTVPLRGVALPAGLAHESRYLFAEVVHLGAAHSRGRKREGKRGKAGGGKPKESEKNLVKNLKRQKIWE